MRIFLKIVDSISEYSGRFVKWFAIALVFVLTYETVARYVFNAPTIWGYVMAMMLYGTIGMLGLAYTDLHEGHIRVDIIYMRLSTRGKAIIDVVLTTLLAFPLFYTLINTGLTWMLRAIKTHERITESYWYPPSWPIRTVVVVALCMFALQYLARFIRDVYKIIKGRPYASTES